MVHFDHESVYNKVATRYSVSTDYNKGWPGFVDFEDGELSGKSTKPSFPTKGIYPNKNTEKSKLFYGMRGVRQRAALFINSVDNRLPRVVLNRTMIIDAAANVPKGIIHLATVDNYDRVEWYRTLDGGKTWQLLIGIRNEDELVEKFTKTEIHYNSEGEVIENTYVDYEEALEGYYKTLTFEGDADVLGCCDLLHENNGVTPVVSRVSVSRILLNDEEIAIRGFVADDRNPYLELFQYGELSCDMAIGGNIGQKYIYDTTTGRTISKITPFIAYPNGGPTWNDYGCHVDIVGIKCRVYKGDAWVDSNTILADGTIIESADSYQPSEIKIALVSEWSVDFDKGKLTIYHKATASGVISPIWEVTMDAWSGWEACAYGSNTWNLYKNEWEDMVYSPEDVELIKPYIIEDIPAYDYYVRCRDLVTKKVSNILRVTCEAGQETPTVEEIILPRINPAEYSRSENLTTMTTNVNSQDLLWVDGDTLQTDAVTIHYKMPYVDGTIWIDVEGLPYGKMPLTVYDSRNGFKPEEQSGCEGSVTFNPYGDGYYTVNMRYKEGTPYLPDDIVWNYPDIIESGCTTLISMVVSGYSTSYSNASTVKMFAGTKMSVTHQISTTVTDAKTLQWQELKSGTWKDMDGETSETLVLGTWTGDAGADEDTARANANAVIPAYDRQFRCVATNIAGTTTEEIRVTHEEGNGTPTVT